MKKLISIVLILITFFVWFNFKDVKALKEEETYILVSETGKKIQATLFYRNVDVEVGQKIENVQEILIFFSKEAEMKFNPIIVVPKFKMIGVIEGGESGFLKLGNKVFQLSEQSNKFTALDNNTYFDNAPVEKINFSEQSISFNSFGGLRKYGEVIMLKKI
ncbi:hypothetical protein [Flavobacterium sp. DG2-3]|uniref:hypothetical protein n=1 Tax=Flavobacterium sp. DG2-3 TaxID=3068317 RepID=UPI00273E80F9|nr:hypothetical protein [Flavobacterium sp. DG2-3]MDP5199866.1 hypothetical protein [Flavobacterium sp. DG2-3]